LNHITGGAGEKSANQGRRLAGVGNKKVLVLRETRSTYSAAHLSSEIFGTGGDAVNLASQYAACSHGQLIFSKWAGDDSVVDGVLTVSIGNTIQDSSENTIRDAMVNQAVKDLGGSSLNSLVDHVMVCIPKGTNGGWIAYTYINHWLSGKLDFDSFVSLRPSLHRAIAQYSQFTTISGATSPLLSCTN
jgi:hypothetical protein